MNAAHWHWPVFCTWWTVIGVGLYAVLLTGSITAKTSTRSWWFAMPAFPLSVYASAPLIVWTTRDSIWGAMTVIIPTAILAVLPLCFQQRKLRAESNLKTQQEAAARQARADLAEACIRKFGA
jgi:hypothetical protein